MQTILVATDLSERSDIAMKRAVFMAREADALVHVLHVVDDDLPETLRAAQCEEAQDVIMARLNAFENDAGRVKTKVSVEFGDPTRAIATAAADGVADLIVMGRHRHRGLADFFSGTTIERLARTTTLPLLVVSRETDGAYAKAVVGVDFSNCAIRAIEIGADIVGAPNLTLVHAYHLAFEGLTMRAGAGGALSKEDRASVEAELRRKVEAWIAGCGRRIAADDVMLREGSAVDLLPAVAAERGAELVCLGAHSRSWLPNAVLGGTAAELLHDRDIDVLIAPL